MKSYVYLVFCKVNKKFYLGSRKQRQKTCDVWVKYFTSSKIVKELIEEYGSSNEIWSIKILGVFDNYSDAIKEEDRLLRSIRNKQKFLNMTFAAHGAPMCAVHHRKITDANGVTIYWPKDVEIPHGYTIGTNNKPPLRKGFRKYIHPYTLDTLIEKERPLHYISVEEYRNQIHDHPKPKKDTWVTNGKENKRVSEYEQKVLLDSGWKLGKTANYTKTVAITDGTQTRYITPKESVPEGWKLGTHIANRQTKDTFVINDGVNSKHIKIGDIIPAGWRKGSLRASMKNKAKIFDTQEEIMFIGEKTVIDGERYVQYDRNKHNKDRLKILNQYKLLKIRLPKNWSKYSIEKLKTILEEQHATITN